MKPIIEVRDISKRYKLGVFNAKTLREEAEAFLARFGRKKAELAGGRQKLAVGSRQLAVDSSLAEPSSDFWALRDVSFEVQPGEVVGIIGRNGAGKSTLLKILSRVTEPTSGEARIRGRVASLLEVGTGFHPELTGRENIFLNGAILGMTKAEIRAKFDEIVAFSGIEKFIDTPVKRYSSGMYVRLAFAVAAHLEPEILIIDEVLAVGDAEFQKKCLGKMRDVAGHGRTVLFVSHNMTAVAELCGRGIYLKNGTVSVNGSIDEAVSTYLAEAMPALGHERELSSLQRSHHRLGERLRMKFVRLLGGTAKIGFREPLVVEIQAEALTDLEDVFLGLGVGHPGGARLFTVEAYEAKIPRAKKGQTITSVVSIPDPCLTPGIYTLSVGGNAGLETALDFTLDCLTFEILAKKDEVFYGQRSGMGLRPRSDWSSSVSEPS
jgi:lipopolysaccharide transport system ATP-binding protein